MQYSYLLAYAYNLENNGASDLLWRTDDGTTGSFTIRSNTIVSSNTFGQIGMEWHVAGVGDFNGDSHGDILMRRDDGTLSLYNIANGQVSGWRIIGQVGIDWNDAGTGHFNTNTSSDFLMRRDDGTLSVYNITNNQVSGWEVLGQVGIEWKVAGIGDFNADGRSDVLMRRNDGTISIYNINHNQVVGWAEVGQVGNEWQVIGIGDFNADSSGDVLMRRDDGTISIFNINENRVSGWEEAGQIGNEWHVASIADFNGDGASDISMRRADGALGVFNVNGNQIINSTSLGFTDSPSSSPVLSPELSPDGPAGTGHILSVGPGQQYSTIAAAIAASQNGDIVQVQAGTYINDFATINTNITLRGVGGMVNMVCTEQIPNGKAILVTQGNDTIENFSFSGAQVSDQNGAGIRYEAGNLVLNNDYFHDNQEGLLAAADPNGTITINNSEFDRNGIGDGLAHNLYVGRIGVLTKIIDIRTPLEFLHKHC